MTYQDDAVAWTEAPSTVGDLWRQRYRWCYGTLQAVWKHRRALVERRSIGWLGLPYASCSRWPSPCSAPSSTSPRSTGWPPAGPVGGGRLAGVLGGTARDGRRGVPPRRRAPADAVGRALQQVAYRQLMYLVVIQSVAAALAGTRLRWHQLRRTGLVAVPAVAYRRER